MATSKPASSPKKTLGLEIEFGLNELVRSLDVFRSLKSHAEGYFQLCCLDSRNHGKIVFEIQGEKNLIDRSFLLDRLKKESIDTLKRLYQRRLSVVLNILF
ncbi:hypothetical protein [Adonisia turfae]|uniref:hypothetical protein n=1 Tax=Adonisia turfae TaxID=2950184 RepID=UPI0013D61F88|nr:hypothetical protein [Adonisia turfae]